MVGISGSVVNHVATSIGTAVYGAPKGRGIWNEQGSKSEPLPILVFARNHLEYHMIDALKYK